MRDQFEKLPEIAEILKNKTIVFAEQINKYYCYHYSVEFINGAWYAFQEQQKKIDAALGFTEDVHSENWQEAIHCIKELLK